MRLISVGYFENRGQNQEWILDPLALGDINLIVGRNSSGKTRTAALIYALARLVSGEMPMTFTSGGYDATFVDGDTEYRYSLEYENSEITKERFTRGSDNLLDRGAGGTGRIYLEKSNEYLEFQSPVNQLAVVSRRDSLQHSFFEPLFRWGQGIHHFAFGTSLGRETLGVIVEGTPPGDLRRTDNLIGVFRRGLQDFPNDFKPRVVVGMKRIGYDIDDAGLETPGLLIKEPIRGEPVCVFVHESGLKMTTQQIHMSQGMFRALSVISHISYAELALTPACMLIDDIGEGLDFERSCALIEYLMERSSVTGYQLIMTTNDRFVMNKVPLDSWTVLERKAARCMVYNYANSKTRFDEFKFTGLNNFDFLATESYATDDEGETRTKRA